MGNVNIYKAKINDFELYVKGMSSIDTENLEVNNLKIKSEGIGKINIGTKNDINELNLNIEGMTYVKFNNRCNVNNAKINNGGLNLINLRKLNIKKLIKN